MNVDLHFLHTYKMFCDLRVPEPVDRDVWIQHMKKLGFGAVAWEQSCSSPKDLNKNIHKPSIDRPALLSQARIPFGQGFQQFSRITLTLQDAGLVHQLTGSSSILSNFDIVAVQPTSEKAFVAMCSSTEVDLITLDMSERLPFYLRAPQVNLAISKGIFFEITYGKAITDSTARKHFINNACSLVRITKGKNTIISSGVKKIIDVRGPYDVMNMGTLFDLNPDKGKSAISRNCTSLLLQAASRRQSAKGQVSVEPATEFEDGQKWKKARVA